MNITNADSPAFTVTIC